MGKGRRTSLAKGELELWSIASKNIYNVPYSLRNCCWLVTSVFSAFVWHNQTFVPTRQAICTKYIIIIISSKVLWKLGNAFLVLCAKHSIKLVKLFTMRAHQ